MDARDLREWEERLSAMLRADLEARANTAVWRRWADAFMASTVQPAFDTIASLFARQHQAHHVAVHRLPSEREDAASVASNDTASIRAAVRVDHASGHSFTYEIRLNVTPQGIDWQVDCSGSAGYTARGLSHPPAVGVQEIIHINQNRIVDSFLDEYEHYLQATRVSGGLDEDGTLA